MTLYEPHRKGPAGRRATAGIGHMLATVTGGLKKSAVVVEESGKKKPAPTHATRPAGRGFWWVGNFQPTPVPVATHTRDLCGLANL